MSLGEICTPSVITIHHDASIQEAAARMRQNHVGSLVVLDGDARPLGIITDRDIVLSVVAAGLEPLKTKVGDTMTQDALVVNLATNVSAALQLMKAKGVRRLPVVDDAGALVGIVAADDLLAYLARQVSALAEVVEHEQLREFNNRP